MENKAAAFTGVIEITAVVKKEEMYHDRQQYLSRINALNQISELQSGTECGEDISVSFKYVESKMPEMKARAFRTNRLLGLF